MQREATGPALLARGDDRSEVEQQRRRFGDRWVRICLGWLAAAAAFVVLTLLLEALSIHGSMQPNSDGATVILEGQSLANGHLTLNGWSLSLDSFWGVDALFYMVGVLIAGVQATFLNLIPAVIAALVIIVGSLIALAGRRGIAAAAGVACVVGILAFPSHALSLDLLLGPLHIGTALWCLVAIYALRSGRFGWWWLVAVLFLAAGALGDLQTVAYGTVPVLLAGIAASVRTRDRRAGLPAMSAAIASIAIALGVHEIAKLVGTFALIKPNPYASWSGMRANISLIGNYFPKLLGAGTAGFGGGGAPYYVQFAHGVALIVVVAGVLVALWNLVRGMVRGGSAPSDKDASWRLDDPLLFSFVGGLVVFVVLTTEAVPSYARYLAPSVIFGALLAARLAGAQVTRLANKRAELPRTIPVSIGALFAATLVVLAIGAGYIVRQPSIESEYQKVGDFLAHRHLYQGVGDYWSSSIVTVETNGLVKVRPVTQGPSGKLVRYDRESTSTWYQGAKFSFLIFNPTLPFGFVNSETATETYGPPEKTWSIDGLEVLLYRNHPFHVGTKGTT